MGKRKILLLVTNSFAALNIIHSGILKILTAEFNVYIISSLVPAGDIKNFNAAFGVEVCRIVDMDLAPESFMLGKLRRVQKALFGIFHKIKTQQIKVQNTKNAITLLIFKVLYLILLPRIAGRLLCFLRKVIIHLSRSAMQLRSLDQVQFDGVISTSPLDLRENRIVNYLAKRNVRSLAIIISWDNLTSKGVMNAHHELMLVWNATMAAEFQKLYSNFGTMPEIRITGIPRFGIYRQVENGGSLNEKSQSNQEVKIILFATSPPKHFPRQEDVIRHLVQYANERQNVKIVLRCHPAHHIDTTNPLCRERNLHIWQIEDLSLSSVDPFSKWLPEPGFLSTLSAMLQSCHVCIHVASTIRLDAAACNKPVINIAYDGEVTLPYNSSVRRLYDYSHQIPLKGLPGENFVYSKNELFIELDRMLDPAYQHQNSEEIDCFVGLNDPSPVDLSINSITEWLK